MKLLVGDLAHHGEGTVWQHQNLRVSYIAQHFLHHLEDNLHLNPKQYVQDRFFKGRDKELAAMETIGLTAEEERQRGAPGQVREVVGRVKRAGQLEYEVEKNGRKPGDTVWVPLSDLRMMPPHVLKLARDYDERLKVMQSGMEVRPITNDEVLAHLAAFGVRGRLAEDPIRGMSGGQKSRLVIAAAMWNKPHLIALDEPTNYLDNETMVTLTAALERFKGAEMIWCQEEPKNQGAWTFIEPNIEWVLGRIDATHKRPVYVGRATSASPATGLASQHKAQQEALVNEALTIEGK